MKVVEFGRLDAVSRRQLEGDEQDPFDARGSTLRWQPKNRHVGIRDERGHLIASAGYVLSAISVDEGEPIAVAGIGGVIVAAPFRGRGLARRVIDALLRRLETLEPELAMLFCHRDRAGLYERHGFLEIPPPVMVKQPGGFEVMPQITMWRALRAGATLPSGRVKLLSEPF